MLQGRLDLGSGDFLAFFVLGRLREELLDQESTEMGLDVLITRETVEISMPTFSAISFKRMGFNLAISPSKK